jgi:hypothetical protein
VRAQERVTAKELEEAVAGSTPLRLFYDQVRAVVMAKVPGQTFRAAVEARPTFVQFRRVVRATFGRSSREYRSLVDRHGRRARGRHRSDDGDADHSGDAVATTRHAVRKNRSVRSTHRPALPRISDSVGHARAAFREIGDALGRNDPAVRQDLSAVRKNLPTVGKNDPAARNNRNVPGVAGG